MSFETRSALSIHTADVRQRLWTGLYAADEGDRTHDSPMCMTCGVKMYPVGSCDGFEACGGTSGYSCRTR